MLDNLSPMWAYIVFILVNSAILGYWIWVLVGWFLKKEKYSGLLKSLCVCIAIFVFLISSAHFINIALKPKDNIEIAPYTTPDSTEVDVHYGSRINDFFIRKLPLVN